MKQEITSHHFTQDDVPAGGHTYAPGLMIAWQNGPLGRDTERQEPNGCFVETVIEAAMDRLEHYQSGRFHSDYNQRALTYLEFALSELNLRTASREQRQVEGTHEV